MMMITKRANMVMMDEKVGYNDGDGCNIAMVTMAMVMMLAEQVS